uniref:WRKY domain-containing protein n=1 Tax=Rhizophora mucronata TaxID=61149 RepID=A0A2P2IU22_RHIMU
MERAADWEQKTLINELTQGKELAKQLRSQLNASSSLETRQFLLEKLLSSYERSLSMLNWSALAAEQKPSIRVLEVPLSIVDSCSSRGNASNKDLKEPKKRKAQQQQTELVRLISGAGREGPFDDGYIWRKYGQKDILGTKFPRGYFRCTHRHSQGCLAVKHVQRTEEDPTIFHATYRGRHTCVQSSRQAATSVPAPVTATSKQAKDHLDPKLEIEAIEDMDLDTSKEHIFPSFSFTEIGKENEGYSFFPDSMMENNFLDTNSTSFVSPATSESNYFSLSPCRSNILGMGDNVHTLASDLTDIISTPTSVTNSPNWNLDFSDMDFASNFPFDNPEFFA